MRIRLRYLTALLLAVLTPTGIAQASWTSSCLPVVTAAYDQDFYQAIPDGAGGTIIVWRDFRADPGNLVGDIYAQRVDVFGNPVWATDGIPIYADGLTALQQSPAIVSDGSGGAIVTWADSRNGAGNSDIYAQRIDASGAFLWTPAGELICSAPNNQYEPAIASDDSGGAIIVWEDFRGATEDLYAQRIDPTGAALWTIDGVPICTQANSQVFPKIVPDGSGGAVIAWMDYRTPYADIYAQRVDAAGSFLWSPSDGVPVSFSTNSETDHELVSDGSGGAIIVWEDNRGADTDIYGQRVDASGATVWTSGGVAIRNAINNQWNPAIVSDGSGGAMVAWEDVSTGQWVVNVRRLSAAGGSLWITQACSTSVEQHTPSLAPDGDGGVIVAWQENPDLHVQRLDALGRPVWTTCATSLCPIGGSTSGPIVVEDPSGAIVVEGMGYSVADIYAQRVDGRTGTWGHPEPPAVSVHDVPGDQGGQVKVDWVASDHDVFNLQEITHYSVWRATDPVAASGPGSSAGVESKHPLVDPSQIGRDFEGPAFIVADGYYWEWLANEDAYYLPGYSYTAQTLNDSTSIDPGIHHFMVMSHTANRWVFWQSQSASGYSTDDLAPAAPAALTATRQGGSDVLLEWTPSGENEPDFAEYAVYRGTSSGVTPDPIFFLSGEADTTHIDTSADPATAYYYVVTAVDVHQNESVPSNEASVTGTATGVDDHAPALTELQVRPNVPNPFGGATEFEVGLPVDADVTFEVYDVVGRRVATHAYPSLAAGWQRLGFDGRSDAGRMLPSGVYFCRVSAAGMVVTRKVVIQR